MTSRIGVVLDSALHSSGAVAAVLVGSDGGVIEAASLAEDEFAPLGVAASEILRQWTAVGTDLGMGLLQTLMIERAGGPMTITPAGPDGMLLIIGHQSCRPGRARLDAKRVKEAMLKVEWAPTEPEGIAPPPPSDHFDHLVRTTAEGSSSSPPTGLTAGEVVVIGAHTFRLVTKLIAQLLQMRGVRSSRLRVYSPSSTIIDVDLEDGATLATVDRGSLEEFSIEQPEQGGTRLILHARNVFSPNAIGSPG